MQGYHLLAAALFAPALVLQAPLLGVALGAALALMIAAEVLRLGHVPVLGAWKAALGKLKEGPPPCSSFAEN